MKLKRLVADLTLDRHVLQEVLRKKFEADAPARARPLDTGALCGECAAGVSAGLVEALDMVSTQPGAGSNAAANAHSGDGDAAHAVRHGSGQ